MRTTFVAATYIILSSLVFATGAPGIMASSTKSVTKLEERVSRDGSDLSVEVFRTRSFSNWHYEIRVTIADKPSQSIGIRNGQELKESDVQLVDVNADGYLDIMVAAGQDHRDKPWFKTFIFSPETSQYRWISATMSANESQKTAEQGGADQPATARESKPGGKEKAESEAEARPQ